jgi:hypothetical protein
MSKKEILNSNPKISNLNELSFSDLYNMYIFVNSLNNTAFGEKRSNLKKLFRNKLEDVQTELYSRVFGENPFKSKDNVQDNVEEIVGQNPIDVIESFSEKEKTETFIVKK